MYEIIVYYKSKSELNKVKIINTDNIFEMFIIVEFLSDMKSVSIVAHDNDGNIYYDVLNGWH